MTTLALSPHRARRWLRERQVEARLPQAGRRLLVVDETGATVIERHAPGEYLFLPVPNSSLPEVPR